MSKNFAGRTFTSRNKGRSATGAAGKSGDHKAEISPFTMSETILRGGIAEIPGVKVLPCIRLYGSDSDSVYFAAPAVNVRRTVVIDEVDAPSPVRRTHAGGRTG